MGVEGAFQQRSIHDGDGGLLEESLESLAKLHGCRPCGPNLSHCQSASYQWIGHLGRGGPWTLFLEVQADARFPRVDQVIPDALAAATRLRLEPGDAAFLGQALDRLPGADDLNGPATLDLNGRVAVRARGVGRSRRPSWSWPTRGTPARRSGSARTAGSWPGRSGSGSPRSMSSTPTRPWSSATAIASSASSRSRTSRRSGRPTTPPASSPRHRARGRPRGRSRFQKEDHP